MGVVKYTGPVASFHCPTSAEIRSLKVHFSPKQEGTGDPSPENIRPIEGWDGVEITHSKKNLFNGIIKVGRDMVGDGTLDGSNTWRTSEPILVKPNTSYTIMHGNTLLKSYINIYDNNMNLLITYTTLSIILTPENAKYITLQRTRSAFESDLKDVAVYETDENIKTNYEFGALGKNKFDKSQYVNGRIMKSNGSNYTADSGYYISPFIPVTVGVSYTKNSPTVDAYHRFATYSSDNVNSFIRVLDTSNTITIESGENYIRFCGEITELDTAQLELGDTTTAYEPYKTVYGGWVDLISGEVCETHYGEALSECNSEALTNQYNTAQTTFFRCQHTYEHERTGNSGVKDLMCETLKPTNTNWGNGDAQDEKVNTITERYNSYIAVCMRMYNSDLGIDAEDDNVVRKTKVNAYLAQHPLFICYKLRTPNTYHLAPTELQTFLGQNNIWSNADYVEVEYDLHETQEILNRKAFIMANQPHLVVPEAAQLQSFTTDVPAPLKECKAYFKPKQDFNGYDRPWPAGGGKNLCDCYNSNNWRVAESPTSRVTTSNIGSISLNNNEVVLNRTQLEAGLSIILGNLDANIEYTLSGIFNNIDNKAYIALLDNNISENYTCTRKFTLTFNNNAVTFTPTESGIYELLIWKTGTGDISLSNLQLEKGSTATSYEPYENICPIEGWESFEVNKCGKNFSTAATGTEIAQKWPFYSSNASRVLQFSGMPPGQEFTLSASFTKAYATDSTKRLYLNGTQKANSTTNNIFCGPSADGPINKVVHNWVELDGTINIAHNNRGLTYNDSSLEYAASLQNIQLELGDTATEYEPYNGITIPITFPTEAGTIYGGYVDLVSGEMWKTWDYKLLSEFAYTFYNGSTSGDGVSRWKFETIPVKPPTSNNELYHGLCAKLKTIAYNNSWNNPYCISPSSQTSGGLITFIILKSMTSTEAADFFSNTYLCYELATPVLLTTLTPTQLKTLRGTNNIWSSANDKIEIKYWKH